MVFETIAFADFATRAGRHTLPAECFGTGPSFTSADTHAERESADANGTRHETLVSLDGCLDAASPRRGAGGGSPNARAGWRVQVTCAGP